MGKKTQKTDSAVQERDQEPRHLPAGKRTPNAGKTVGWGGGTAYLYAVQKFLSQSEYKEYYVLAAPLITVLLPILLHRVFIFLDNRLKDFEWWLTIRLILKKWLKRKGDSTTSEEQRTQCTQWIEQIYKSDWDRDMKRLKELAEDKK